MQHIAILDYGSQYTHLIARRIREIGVLAKIYPDDVTARQLPTEVTGIILSGGPQSVYADGSPDIDPEIFSLGIPILGLCYGHQLMAKKLGGQVAPGTVREYGPALLTTALPCPLTREMPRESRVWMSHGDTVTIPPEGFTVAGTTSDCPVAAMADPNRQFYGLQFHPEVMHTECGMEIISRFVFDIAGLAKNWQIANLIDDLILSIQNQVAGRSVFMLVSGGVDSSVAYALLAKALGPDRVYGLYIDTGFMRANESAEIQTALQDAGFGNIRVKDAGQIFKKRLRDIIDPETKRKIIGQTFLDIKDEAAKEAGLDAEKWMLGQGTIYPDTIETGGTKHAGTIKTHHNRVDAIQKLIAEGKVVEPIADFYKDEVRQIGKRLSLPDSLIERHPFPGPGLAIRILCSSPDTADNSGLDGINKEAGINLWHRVLPIRSVGVQGDNRTYARPLVLAGEKDWKKLDDLSSSIPNRLRTVNRVLLLLNPAPDASFALPPFPSLLTPERVALLQAIDTIVGEEIRQAGIYRELWQFPVVLAPVGNNHFESVILRPVVSQEAMTANFARLPWPLIDRIVSLILETNKIDYVFYDITNKPPGTIEWE